MEQIDSIADRLTLIAEELNDLAMHLLSEAISEGRNSRPELEKRVSQARRTVEKAAHQLQSISND